MGIVVNQTSKNILTISFALILGGINTLYFILSFLQAEYYGLVVFLLATSIYYSQLCPLELNIP